MPPPPLFLLQTFAPVDIMEPMFLIKAGLEIKRVVPPIIIGCFA